MLLFGRCVLVGVLCVVVPGAWAKPVCVQDDTDQTVCLAGQARAALRVVSLAPHTTEMVAFLGEEKRLVGLDSASDFPVQLKNLPKVGDYLRVDLERLLVLKPDLVLAWGSGTSPDQLQTLRKLGVPVFVSEPLSLALVASNMVRLSALLGQSPQALRRIEAWKSSMAALRARHAGAKPVRVFYQIWREPLMTLSGKHVVSEVIRLCGGQNVFDALPVLAPTVGTEAVLQANPDVIFSSGTQLQLDFLQATWGRWPQLQAVRNKQLAVVPPDVLVRNGPRLLEATQAVCALLDRARQVQN